MHQVKAHGDVALLDFTQRFDGVRLENLRVTDDEVEAAYLSISTELLDAIRLAANNIRRFHEAQLKPEPVIETMPGVQCWRQIKPIERIGLYIPGGTAPLFSTILMLAIPASLAGCQEKILCTPPNKAGGVHPAILVAARESGISAIYKVGGAQAIAAMTFGTETIPAVYKIFGPGNQYVTAAKQLAQLDGVAIDMPAGPSEVCVWADEHANPAFVAADLLSQAEHGRDSQVLLVCNSADFAREVANALQQQTAALSRSELAMAALKNSRTVILENTRQAIDFINAYAPEHLIINHAGCEDLAQQIVNAGSIFLGSYSPESAGDYASGTNHTLPTNGYARVWSGVSVDSFVKKITVQKISREGLSNIGPAVITMAMAEGLDAHANAVSIRLNTAI